MNPPYGFTLRHWVRAKPMRAPRAALPSSACLPARTDTHWWHEYLLPYAEVRFIRERLKFNGTGTAPFPSAVAVFRSDSRL
jgi:hypothetical protein